MQTYLRAAPVKGGERGRTARVYSGAARAGEGPDSTR